MTGSPAAPAHSEGWRPVRQWCARKPIRSQKHLKVYVSVAGAAGQQQRPCPAGREETAEPGWPRGPGQHLGGPGQHLGTPGGPAVQDAAGLQGRRPQGACTARCGRRGQGWRQAAWSCPGPGSPRGEAACCGRCGRAGERVGAGRTGRQCGRVRTRLRASPAALPLGAGQPRSLSAALYERGLYERGL